MYATHFQAPCSSGALCCGAHLLEFDADSATQKELSAYMDARVRENDFSGSVLVSRSGKRCSCGGMGWQTGTGRSRTRHRRNSGSALYKGVYSCLDHATARARISRLERKHLQLHFPCPATWQQVTVHQLLSHTGGIHSFTDDPEFADDVARNRDRTPEQVLSLFRDRPLDFAPGTDIHYSNAGYFLLGRIIERLSGMSYEVALHDRIFQPLGMSDSGYDLAETILPERASGYAFRDGKFVKQPPSIRGGSTPPARSTRQSSI